MRAPKTPIGRRALLAAVAGGAAAAALPRVAGADPDLPVAGSIGVIGDSLTYACRLLEANALATAGWGVVKIDGRGSRRIPDSAPAPYSGVKALRAMRAAGFDPPALVVELGTNDIAYAAKNGQDLRTLVLEMLDAVNAGGAGRRVLWVDVLRHDMRRTSARFNALLDAIAASRPEQLAVCHWSGVAASRDAWFQDDGIHLTEEGCLHRARFVALASHVLRAPAGVAGAQ